MVSENGEGVGCKGAGGYVEHCRKQLTGNLVHIWNHQEKTLRSRIGGSKGTSLKGSVDSAGSTSLTLHLGDLYGFTPKVLLAVSGPLVNILSHC